MIQNNKGTLLRAVSILDRQLSIRQRFCDTHIPLVLGRLVGVEVKTFRIYMNSTIASLITSP